MSTSTQSKSLIKGLREQYDLDLRIARRAAEKSLMAYINACLINCAGDPQYFGNVAEDWQVNLIKSLAPAIETIAGIGDGKPPYRKFWITLPRGSDKTSLCARLCNWLMAFSKRRVNGVVAASSRDQALILADAMRHEADLNPWFRDLIDYQQHRVLGQVSSDSGLPQNQMQIISAESAGYYGHMSDFIICDELTVWSNEELWHSLISTQPKRQAIIIALSNAGWKNTWQWTVHEMVAGTDDWFLHEPTGPDAIAGWIDRRDVEEQQKILPDAVFRRLWHNEWCGERGDFLSMDEIVQCINPSLEENREGEKGRHYYIGVDYGEKKDRTVATVVHRDNGKIIIDEQKVWVPTKDRPVHVAIVEAYCRFANERYNHPTIVIDPWQLATLDQQAPAWGLRMHRWNATSTNQQQLAQNLRTAVLCEQIEWYKGCGSAPGAGDLQEEMAELVVKETERGWKFDHKSGAHDDRCISLGMALSTAIAKPIGERIPNLWF